MPDQVTVQKMVRVAEAHLGERVLKVRAPGGRNRGSLLLELADRSVYVSRRESDGRTRLEADVLGALSPETDLVPQFLGIRDGLAFQSDLGSDRISLNVRKLEPDGQYDLAYRAVRSLFEIHAAARRVDLHNKTPQLGASRDWVAALVGDAHALPGHIGHQSVRFDEDAVIEFIGTPRRQFVKWDARSGNAVVDVAGTVRWFDFEYAGTRHGAEEFAWLIGDEVWPVPAETMMSVIEEAFEDPELTWPAYRRYIEVFTVFHAVQRLNGILAGITEKGWMDFNTVLRKDKIGRNPHFVCNLARNAAWMADRNAMTAPLSRMFDRLHDAVAATITPPSEDPPVPAA